MSSEYGKHGALAVVPQTRMNQPLVSIVTPSFNQAQFLELALRSVQAQQYARIEHIVIDGGSSDGSPDILRRYEPNLSYWESQPDAGQADAINRGLKRAAGEVVAWLNSDDAYLPGAVGRAVEALTANPQLGMVYGDGLMVDADLRLLDPHRYPQVNALDLLCFETILQPATFMSRRALEAVGTLDDRYHLILDHELWIRIAASFDVLHVPEFWALERTHGEAKTIAQARQFVEEAEHLVEAAAHDDTTRQLVEHNRRRVYAGLHVFAARRLIDAGDFSAAVGRLAKAARLYPRFVIRYWYKVVQAVGSALGLAKLFVWYREMRRRVQFRGARVDLDGPLPID